MILHQALTPDLVRTIPFGYVKLITFLGLAIFLLRGGFHLWRLWHRQLRLQSAIACAFLVGAACLVEGFLDQYMPAEGAALLSLPSNVLEIGFWLQIALFGSVPALVRAAALDVVCSLTPVTN